MRNNARRLFDLGRAVLELRLRRGFASRRVSSQCQNEPLEFAFELGVVALPASEAGRQAKLHLLFSAALPDRQCVRQPQRTGTTVGEAISCLMKSLSRITLGD